MKKKLMISLFVMLLGCGSTFAQSDAFFTSRYIEYREDNAWGIDMPLLPGSHGYLGDYSCAEEVPLGSGLLVLGGLAFGYALRKRSES